MQISEIKPQTKIISLEACVISKGIPRVVNTSRGSSSVCDAIVEDATGKIKLVLWNDEIDKVNIGDFFILKWGWAREYQGKLQISTGNDGSLDVLNEKYASSLKIPYSKKKPKFKEDKIKMKKYYEDIKKEYIPIYTESKKSSRNVSWEDKLIAKRLSENDPSTSAQRNIDSKWKRKDG